jgi:long-chain acyl-CoA synthetase
VNSLLGKHLALPEAMSLVAKNIDTLPKCIKRNYEKWGDRKVAMRQKRRGIWQEYTWKDEYERIKSACLGLIALGLERGDTVCIIGGSCVEYYWLMFAVHSAGACVTGLSWDSLPSEIEYIARHSRAKFLVPQGQEQVDNVQFIKHNLPHLQTILYLDPKGLNEYDHSLLISFAELMKSGENYRQSYPDLFEQRVNDGKPDDIANIFYTSGTTGTPKGAMLSHGVLMAQWEAVVRTIPAARECNFFCSLPPSSMIEGFTSVISHAYSGSDLNFPEKPETTSDDFRQIAPNWIGYSSDKWEAVVSKIQLKINETSPFQRFLYTLALQVGYKARTPLQGERKPPFFWRYLSIPCYWAVFRPLLDKFGLVNAIVPVTTGAVLSEEAQMLLSALGLRIRQLYGMTECGFVTAHRDSDVDYKTVGAPLFGIEIRISPDGELLIRGHLFSGYYRDPEKTQKVLQAGWLYTGDAAYINNNGQLVFLDKILALRRLPDGNTYAPQHIEAKLKFSPYIKDAVVVGGQKNKTYVSAVINIDYAAVGDWAKKHHITYTSFSHLSQQPEVASLISKHVCQVNDLLPESCRVRKFVLLHKELDPDDGELTRSGKLRRDFFENRYVHLINAIYEDREQVYTEARVTYRDGSSESLNATLHIWQTEV